MTVRKVYIGSFGPILYEDTELIGDVDGDFLGATRKALATDGDILGVIGGVVGLTIAVLAVTGDHTLNPDTDAVLLASADGGKITVTLPTAVGIEGRLFWVKKTDSSRNCVVLKGAGVETIDGENELDIVAQYDAPAVVSDNANWMLI